MTDKYIDLERGIHVYASQVPEGCRDEIEDRWGALYTAYPGEWVVEQDGFIDVVDPESFERDYKKVQE